MKNQKICIVSFSNIAWDSRVLREIHAAAQHYQVDVIGFGDWQPPEGVRFISIPKTKRDLRYLASYVFLLLAGRLYSRAWDACFWQKKEYRKVRDILRDGGYDLIHANDWDALPVAVTAVQGTKTRVLFDAHEYSVDQETDVFFVGLRTPFREYLLRRFGGEVARMITVGDGIRDLYFEHFGWQSDVIMNAPHYIESQFHTVDPSHIKLVHHGGAVRGRHLEDLIYLMKYLEPRFILHFILLPSEEKYYDQLQTLAREIAPDRIVFHDAVKPHQLSGKLTEFDVGIPWLRATNLNHINALPNKFFDYIMSGLGIAVLPLPSMQQLIHEHGLGVVSATHMITGMAEVLNRLTVDEIDQFKQNSLSLAKVLNADVEMKKLMQIYENLLSD